MFNYMDHVLDRIEGGTAGTQRWLHCSDLDRDSGPQNISQSLFGSIIQLISVCFFKKTAINSKSEVKPLTDWFKSSNSALLQFLAGFEESEERWAGGQCLFYFAPVFPLLLLF